MKEKDGFHVGDIVRHDFTKQAQGTVTELRDDEQGYNIYVKWDSFPDRNDWYKAEVLEHLRGGGTVMTLGDIKLPQ